MPPTLCAYWPAGRGVPLPPLAGCQCARRERKYAGGAQAEEEEEALPIHWVDYNETHHYHHVEPKKCSWESAGIVHHEPQ